jgi:hypothetical protein
LWFNSPRQVLFPVLILSVLVVLLGSVALAAFAIVANLQREAVLYGDYGRRQRKGRARSGFSRRTRGPLGRRKHRTGSRTVAHAGAASIWQDSLADGAAAIR